MRFVQWEDMHKRIKRSLPIVSSRVSQGSVIRSWEWVNVHIIHNLQSLIKKNSFNNQQEYNKLYNRWESMLKNVPKKRAKNSGVLARHQVGKKKNWTLKIKKVQLLPYDSVMSSKPRGPRDTDAFPESQSNVNVIHTVCGSGFGGNCGFYFRDFIAFPGIFQISIHRFNYFIQSLLFYSFESRCNNTLYPTNICMGLALKNFEILFYL